MSKTSKGEDVKKEGLNIKQDWDPSSHYDHPKGKVNSTNSAFGLVKNIVKF